MSHTNIKRAVWFTVILLTMGAGLFVVIHMARAEVSGSKQSDAPDSFTPDSFTVDGDTITIRNEAAETAKLETYLVNTADVPSTLTLSGRTDLDQERVTHVHAQFPGKVVQVGTADHPLQLGDKVKGPEGGGTPDTLCYIESTDLANAKAAYLQADVQLTLDLDNLGRTRELLKKQILAEKYLLDAEAAVTKDRAVLDASRQQLLVFGLTDDGIKQIAGQQGKARMNYSLTSPRTGMIVEKGVVGGELADPTLNLFTVADTTTLWVWGDVYERDRTRVKEGQQMKVILTSDPEHPRNCTVKWVSPVIDATTRSIKIRGDLDNTDGHLLAQMYATVVVTVSDGKDSMIVPADAVVRKGPRAFVFVVVRSDAAGISYRRTPVKVEAINAGPGLESLPAAGRDEIARGNDASLDPSREVRITEGLRAGQRIVKSGALGLFNEVEQQQSQTTAGTSQQIPH